MRWNLDDLYTGFESDAWKNDMILLETQTEWLENWKSGQKMSAEDAEQYIAAKSSLYDKFIRALNFAELTFSVDAAHTLALNHVEKLENLMARLAGSQAAFEAALGALGDEEFQTLCNASEVLDSHRFFLGECRKSSQHRLSHGEEILMARMKTTGSAAWGKLQETLTATMQIRVEGEEHLLPLPVVRNMAYDADQEVRRKAYEAELAAYPAVETAIAAALSGIKGEVLTTAEARRYESPLAMTLKHSRMDKDTLEAMMAAIEEHLPDFRRFFRLKARLLGYQGGLKFWDLFAPVGSAGRTYTLAEAREMIVRQFSALSPELSAFADHAFESGWIDAEPRPGKRGGAFCSNIHPIGQSRVMTNFTGSYGDISTLAHELGHAWHGDCLKNEKILNSDYPMPVAETASIFCELLIEHAAMQKATPEEALTLTEHGLTEAGQVVVDIYSRYLFEQSVFEARKEGSVPAATLCGMMLEAQEKAYGNGLDAEVRHPYMWACKPHYYSAEYNYYNFPYAFGLLFATGLFAQFEKQGAEFSEGYKRLLAMTGKADIAEVAAAAGVDVRDISFWRASLAQVVRKINRFEKLVEEQMVHG